VGILSVGAGGKLDVLVRALEADIEPGEEGVGVVVAGSFKLERDVESEVLLLRSEEIDLLEHVGVGDDGLEVDSIHKGLAEGDVLDAGVVKAVDGVPEVDLLVLVLLVLDGGDVDGSFVGEEETVWGEVLVPSEEDGVEHGLVEKEVAHPFRDDDVVLFQWQFGLFELSFYKGDSCELDKKQDTVNLALATHYL